MSVDFDTFGQIDKQFARHAAWDESKRVGILRFFEEGDRPEFLVSIQKKGWIGEDPSLWCILIPGEDLNSGRIIIPSSADMVLRDRAKSHIFSKMYQHNSGVVREINISEQENDGGFVVKNTTGSSCILELNGLKVAQNKNDGGFSTESLVEGISIEFGKSFPNLKLNPLRLPKSIYDGLRALYPQD